MSLLPKPDAYAFKAYRLTYECSMQQAKTALYTHWRQECLITLRTTAHAIVDDSARHTLIDLIDLLLKIE